jgi:hypothetical protein
LSLAQFAMGAIKTLADAGMAGADAWDCVEQVADEVIVEYLVERHHAVVDEVVACACPQ